MYIHQVKTFTWQNDLNAWLMNNKFNVEVVSIIPVLSEGGIHYMLHYKSEGGI